MVHGLHAGNPICIKLMKFSFIFALQIVQAECLLSQPLVLWPQIREKIEMSGRDARWEFPKQLLFQRTNYMADICKDLAEMVEVVDDFFKFLGPELKAVTGDTQGIDRWQSILTIKHQ